MKELFSPGHRACAGCGATIAVRQVLEASGENVICTSATGCLEVTTTPYPHTAWGVPWIHVAFENSAAVASGIDAAYKAFVKKGMVKENPHIIAFGGDGGTFDIGLQALSGMFERGHNILYVCYDNEAYMNTGIQRCSSTPYGASTTTSPSGKLSIGESRRKKPIAMIAAAHNIPYVATASIAFPADLKKKVRKGLQTTPAFLHIFAPCPTGWRIPSEKTVELARVAVETGVFPLYEITCDAPIIPKITKRRKEGKMVEEYLQTQGRFRHLFKPQKQEDVLKSIQKEVDEKWKWLEGLNEMAR